MANGYQGRARYPQRPSNNHTTFFFSNFPYDYGEYDMIKIFQRWARVKEVFISRRLNRWGRRFGFVRFFDVANVSRLEKELDQIYLGKMKLNVNIPRYRRTDFGPRKEEEKQQGNGSREKKYKKV
ncbi:uncharacterized protein [Phaseolus vulgaris]|uniref:uncharacterized protein n=1 Tax=Phaseolus vulgaris TaxID=3885 RepID=UPI0035C9C086